MYPSHIYVKHYVILGIETHEGRYIYFLIISVAYSDVLHMYIVLCNTSVGSIIHVCMCTWYACYCMVHVQRFPFQHYQVNKT